MHPELAGILYRFLTGRVCLLGIGNRMWRDDGVGSVTVEALQDHPGFDTVDGGMVPENYLETVVGRNPDTILIIDAVDFNGRPGELRLLEPGQLAGSGLSTHAGSPATLAQYLELRTGARVGLLAIQPGDTSEGSQLSPEVAATMRDLVQEMAGRAAAPARHLTDGNKDQ